MIENKDYTDEFETIPTSKKSPIKKYIIVAAVIILAFVVFLYIVTEYLPQQRLINAYVNASHNDLKAIETTIEDGDYYSAIEMLENYKEKYSKKDDNDKYYKKLSEQMQGETVYPKYMNLMVQTLDENINKALPKLNGLIFKTDDLSLVCHITDNLYALYVRCPDGVSYTTKDGEEEFYDVDKMYDEYYHRFQCEKIILQYQTASESSKHYSISNMIGLNNTYGLDSNLKNRVSSQLAKMKLECQATDYAVTGGSSEIYLYKNQKGEYVKKFGWVCPKCGYDDNEGMIPRDVTLSGHYIGEVITRNGMMSCAGKWVGGCGGLSEYTLEITYK